MRGRIGLAISLLTLAAPLAAQLGATNGDSFLKAVRETDGTKATDLLDANGSTVLSYRGGKGENALGIVAARRDMTWLAFLLGRGADPNIADDRGETPLIISSRLGWAEGAKLLLGTGAKVDALNKLGETALIAAVQGRQMAMVRLLLESGADPDKADRAAGYSARDYARRDGRSTEITRLIETVKPKTKVFSGPVLR